MKYWMHPPELARGRERDDFDPVAEGERHGLSRELSLATWDRISAEATDSAGRQDAEDARRRFRDLAARIQARGGRLRPDAGRLTRVQTEITGIPRRAWPVDGLALPVPGRTRHERDPAIDPALEPRRRGQPLAGELHHDMAPVARLFGGHARLDASRADLRGGRVDRRATAVLDDAPPPATAIDPLALSAGHALPADLAARLSRTLGRDVSAVRVHTDEIAARVAAELRAEAFTIGADVFFAAGRYQPGTAEGERLIAHEVVHTVQQRDAAAADLLEVSSPGDRHEVEADRFADAFVARGVEAAPAAPGFALSDGEAAALTPAGVAAIQRRPEDGGGTGSSGGGGGLPAVVSVRIPDVELFPRKTLVAKSWNLGSFEKTLLDRTIVIKGVPIRVVCEVSGDASATLNSSYGPAKLTGIVAETETHMFTTEQKIKLAAAFVIGPGVFVPLLLHYLRNSTVKQHAHGHLTAGVELDASIDGNLAGKLAIKDPSGVVGGGGFGRLNANARGHAGFDVFSDIDFYLEDGKVSQIDADLGIAAECDLAFDLTATIGAFLEINEEGERKRQGGGELPQGGTGLVPMPPGWPEDRFPWKPPKLDPWTPAKWRKEWSKTWPLVHKTYGWILKGSATVTADRGAGAGELDIDEKDVDMDALCDFYMTDPPDTAEPVDEPTPSPDGPSQGEVSQARTAANDAIVATNRELGDEAAWTGTELSRTENDLARSPPSPEEKPKFDAYLKELRDRKDLIERSKRAMQGLRGDFAEADRKARSSNAQQRREAIADFNCVTDNAEDIENGIATRPERPERARRRNRYNARREGGGFVGEFKDFPDWDGYPTGATRHPANKLTGNTGGAIPRPSGSYRVPGPSTPGNKHNEAWRRELYGERDMRKQALENEFRRSNPGQQVPDMTQKANDDIVKLYQSRGFALGWDELDLQGFEEHHIHESSWGGPHADSNLIYLRESEHQPSTTWWEGRKADVYTALAADDP